MKFRNLTAGEVECRVASTTEKGVSLLLYKDARCDMKILDETVGAEFWQRKHELINGNLFCSVGIYSEKLNDWIWKQDVGTESYTEKEKGQASDSFKRACFNWGIGRELYTAPFIWVNADMKQNNGKWITYDKFEVTEMIVKDGIIESLKIANAKTKATVFTYGQKSSIDADYLAKFLESKGVDVKTVYTLYKVSNLNDLSPTKAKDIVAKIDKIKEWQAENGN